MNDDDLNKCADCQVRLHLYKRYKAELEANLKFHKTILYIVTANFFIFSLIVLSYE